MSREFAPRIDRICTSDDANKVTLDLFRIDEIDVGISGNKWWKLKYNFQEMKKLGKSQLITFGGAYSNHIAATAEAGKRYDIKTIGIIRGEENNPINSTLKLAIEK